MGKKTVLAIQYIIFLGGGIFLVWWQFSKMTIQEYKDFKFALYNADYRVLIPIILIAVSIFISRAMRWRIMIAPMGYTPSLFNTFGATMAGLLANTFLPRIGEILKCTILGKYEKIPVQKLIGTVVVERIFDLLCYLILILFTFFIQYKLVGSFIKDTLNRIVIGTSQPLWMTGLLIFVIIAAVTFILRFVFKRYADGRIAVKIKIFLAGLKEGISSISKLQKRGWFLFHTVYIWSMYLLQVYIGFSAFTDLNHLGFNAACAVLTLATFANIITPGGLGAFPTAIFLILSLYNINQTTGEAFGWLMWGVTTFIILFFGLLFLGLLYFNNRKKQQDEVLYKSVIK